jgi:hypothetical protein
MTSTPLTAQRPGGIVQRVLDEVRRGGTQAAIAARTGLPADLVQAVLAELVRTGVVGTASCSGAACTVAQAPREERPVQCATCPLVR